MQNEQGAADQNDPSGKFANGRLIEELTPGAAGLGMNLDFKQPSAQQHREQVNIVGTEPPTESMYTVHFVLGVTQVRSEFGDPIAPRGQLDFTDQDPVEKILMQQPHSIFVGIIKAVVV